MRKLAVVIAYYGSQSKLAARLGVTEGSISQWVCADSMPPRRALQVEVDTQGLIRAKNLVSAFKNVKGNNDDD